MMEYHAHSKVSFRYRNWSRTFSIGDIFKRILVQKEMELACFFHDFTVLKTRIKNELKIYHWNWNWNKNVVLPLAV